MKTKKESVIKRRTRELYKSGIIDRDYEQVEGRGPRCVRYKLAPEPSLKPANTPILHTTDKIEDYHEQLSFN
jgi:predicted transcriptional regulator